VIRRAVHLLLRLLGWLLTPLAVTLAAALGATVGTMVAPITSPVNGLMVTAASALLGGAVGLWLWLRLVRATPALQEVLAVSPSGVPTEEALEEFVHPVQSEDPPPS
jgi:hypothetical protein